LKRKTEGAKMKSISATEIKTAEAQPITKTAIAALVIDRKQAKQEATAAFERAGGIMRAGLGLVFGRATSKMWKRSNAGAAGKLAGITREELNASTATQALKDARAAGALEIPLESEAVKTKQKELKQAEDAEKAALARLPAGKKIKTARNEKKAADFEARITAIGTATRADLLALLVVDAEAEDAQAKTAAATAAAAAEANKINKR